LEKNTFSKNFLPLAAVIFSSNAFRTFFYDKTVRIDREGKVWRNHADGRGRSPD
jgi:hypothetical protein